MRRIILCLLSAGLLLAPASSFAYEDGDWQYWNTESVKGKLTDRITAYVETEFRFGDDASEFYYQHTHLEPIFKITDWFDLGIAYRQIYELYTTTKTEEADWFTEYRPMVNGTIHWKWSDWSLNNRSRISYKMFDIDKDDAFEFRNKTTIKSPWKWTALQINPYIAEEFYLLEDHDGIYRNRLYAGVNLKLMEHLKGEVFYLWQTTEKNNDWIDYNVVGTKLKVEF